ncbi:unnamed protein product [Cylindrotheca closterium]|uniref:Glycerophosphodiester phosphodiesterase n=1 Tax=Cylindrotheca closterium TaxID=2856 RepID=A0AAD2GA57_9STRA|nr:unnamed protein product [Cylindrotheca closterium]
MICLQKTGPNAKPLSPNKNHRQIQRVTSATVLFCVLLLAFSSSSRSSLRGAHELHLNPQCSALKQFRICSHQLLDPPENQVVGSLKAMSAFWAKGIKCFDIDAVTTKDGQLLASHPVRLIPRISPNNSQNFDSAAYTLEEMRKLGADKEGYPLLYTVFEHYASLVNNEATKKPFYAKGSNYLEGPLFNVDLKGPNLTAKHMDDILDKLVDLGIRDNVAICANPLKEGEIGPGVDMLKHVGPNPSRGNVGLVLRDREDNDRNIAKVKGTVQSNPSIRSYVASYKFEKDYFSKIRGMPIIAWTIDTAETLSYAIENGAAGIVTNHPIRLLNILQGWIEKDQCT